MLRARPDRLAAAVADLTLPGREPAEGAARLEEQRQRLLAIPVEQLARYRIHPRALEILPTLAVEVRHAPLRERVIALATAQAEQLTWTTLARLLPWIAEDDEFRRRVLARAHREPPRAPLPRWLVVHWREALGREAPTVRLAEAALVAEPVLPRLLPHLQLPVDTPLARAVLAAALRALPDDALLEQPYTETLRFIEHSGSDPLVRIALLRRILGRFGGQARSPGDLEGPLAELHAVAHQLLLGGPEDSPGLWRDVPASARRVARWYQRLMALQSVFPPGDPRVAAWRPWLRHIVRAEQLPLIQVVWVQLADRVFVEADTSPRLCRVYGVETWQQFTARLAAAGQPIPPPRPLERLPLDEDAAGRSPISRFIQQRLGLTP